MTFTKRLSVVLGLAIAIAVLPASALAFVGAEDGSGPAASPGVVPTAHGARLAIPQTVVSPAVATPETQSVASPGIAEDGASWTTLGTAAALILGIGALGAVILVTRRRGTPAHT